MLKVQRRQHAGLPLGEAPEAILAETLFGQMLNLPRSRKRAIAYSMLMVPPPAVSSAGEGSAGPTLRAVMLQAKPAAGAPRCADRRLRSRVLPRTRQDAALQPPVGGGACGTPAGWDRQRLRCRTLPRPDSHLQALLPSLASTARAPGLRAAVHALARQRRAATCPGGAAWRSPDVSPIWTQAGQRSAAQRSASGSWHACHCQDLCRPLQLHGMSQHSAAPAAGWRVTPRLCQVDLCQLLKTFPRPMSGCIKACFQRMGALDPELRVRLARWLAMHLVHFEFMWPWQRWSHAFQAPEHDAQRCAAHALLRPEAALGAPSWQRARRATSCGWQGLPLGCPPAWEPSWAPDAPAGTPPAGTPPVLPPDPCPALRKAAVPQTGVCCCAGALWCSRCPASCACRTGAAWRASRPRCRPPPCTLAPGPLHTACCRMASQHQP